MTKTAKWSMIGVLAALVLALFAVAGCSSDNAGNNDNGGDNANPATENNDNGNGNNCRRGPTRWWSRGRSGR